MKKLILSTLTFLAIISFTTAQQSFGVKGGFHLSNLATDKAEIQETNNKLGYSIGLMNRTEKGFMVIQTELLWTRKGAKYTLANGATDVNANLDYIEIPLSYGVTLFDSPISVYGGVYGAYLIGANYEYKDSNENVIATNDSKDRFNKLDFGAQLGLQFKLDKLLIDARYSKGIRNVESDDIQVNNQVFDANDTKNFNFQIGVGILF